MGNFIISGIGPGMGCSIAREFKSHKMSIGLISRSDFGANLAGDIGCLHRKADLKDYRATQIAIDDLAERLGGIDGVVHCAGGFFSNKSIVETDPDQFNEALQNNAVTFFNVTKSSLNHLMKKGGSITAISAARNVYYGSNPGYSAGKGSIVYMVRTFARDLARFNIRVNSVAPGFIQKNDCGKPLNDIKLLGLERYPSEAIGRIVFSIATNSIITGQDVEADGGVSSQIPPN
jgi:NAD(P)-dependent dehydrogenase (short-subunit alcohol dehydrogenase family)